MKQTCPDCGHVGPTIFVGAQGGLSLHFVQKYTFEVALAKMLKKLI